MDDPPADLDAAMDDYRSGVPLTSIATTLGVSFDEVASSVISRQVSREVPLTEPSAPDPPPELEDPDWIRSRLEAGWAVGKIAQQLGTTEEAVGGALSRFGFTLASSSDGGRDVERERSELVEQFRSGAARVHAARTELGHAVAMQADAVAGLASSGLTVPAIADRLDLDEAAVEELLDDRAG